MIFYAAEFQAESDLEDLLEAEPGHLGRGLMIIGRQVHLSGPKRRRIDLLTIDAAGTIWIIELKVGITTTKVLRQVFDYGFWIQEQGRPWIERYYTRTYGATLADAFAERFGRPLPAAASHTIRLKLMVVAAGVDPVTDDAMTAMQRHDIPIEAVTFSFDITTSTYAFSARAAVPGAGPKRRDGSNSLRSDIEAMRGTIWVETDAYEQAFGQPPRGAFGHRTNVRIAKTDPLAEAEWLWFIPQFAGRCVPTRFLYEKYLDSWAKLVHPRPDAKPLTLARFGSSLRMAVARTPGWAEVRRLAPEAVERERQRLTELYPAWSTIRVGLSWSGYARTQDF